MSEQEDLLKYALFTACAGFFLQFIWSFLCVISGQKINGVGMPYDIVSGITGILYMLSIIWGAFCSKKAIVGMLLFTLIGSALVNGLAMLGVIGLIVGMLLLILISTHPWLIFFLL